jgi:hypothetical protein
MRLVDTAATRDKVGSPHLGRRALEEGKLGQRSSPELPVVDIHLRYHSISTQTDAPQHVFHPYKWDSHYKRQHREPTLGKEG